MEEHPAIEGGVVRQDVGGDEAPVGGLEVGAVEGAGLGFGEVEVGDVGELEGGVGLADDGVDDGLTGLGEVGGGHGVKGIPDATDGAASVEDRDVHGRRLHRWS